MIEAIAASAPALDAAQARSRIDSLLRARPALRALFEDAEDYYEQAITLATEQRDIGHQGVARLMLGVLQLERGDADRACVIARSAWDLLRSIDPATAAIALAYLAVALAAQGLASAARVDQVGERARSGQRQRSNERAVRTTPSCATTALCVGRSSRRTTRTRARSRDARRARVAGSAIGAENSTA